MNTMSSKRPFAATILTDQPSTLLYLSQTVLKQLEREAPAAVVAIHRVMAANLGNKLFRAHHLVAALEC